MKRLILLIGVLVFTHALYACDDIITAKILRTEDDNKISYTKMISKKEVGVGKVNVTYFKFIKQNAYQGSLDCHCPIAFELAVRRYDAICEKSGWQGVFLALVNEYVDQLNYVQLDADAAEC